VLQNLVNTSSRADDLIHGSTRHGEVADWLNCESGLQLTSKPHRICLLYFMLFNF